MTYENFKILWVSFNQAVNFNYAASDTVISVAFEMLGAYPDDLLRRALKMCLSECKYQIQVSDVIEKIKSIHGVSDAALEIKAGNEFNKLVYVLKTWGLLRSYLSEDPVTPAVIDCFGGLNEFYNLDWNVFTKKDFVKFYLECAKRENKHQIMKAECALTEAPVMLITEDYKPGINKTLILTIEQAEKMINHADLFSKKVEFMRQEEKKKEMLLNQKLIECEEQKKLSKPVAAEEIAAAFEKVFSAFGQT